MQGICQKCFKRSDISPPLPDLPPVCRGCTIEIERILGWLENAGFALFEIKTGKIPLQPASEPDPALVPWRDVAAAIRKQNREADAAAAESAPENDPPKPPQKAPEATSNGSGHVKTHVGAQT